MTTIHDTYINALLADASYRDGLDGLSGDDLARRLEGRMTPELARYISNNFIVLMQVGGLDSSFDATVWQEKGTGNIYVSMRGTQEAMDFAEDASLATTGLAHGQLADMVNWWLRATTTGQAQQIAVQTTIIPAPIPIVVRNFVPAPSVQGTGELAGIGAIKSVNGHSLGGYLASAFVRLFGGQWPVESINTFNSAGFSRLATINIENGFDQIAQAIGPALGLGTFSSAQNNYFAENGINVTTNTWNPVGFQQYGGRAGIFQEDGVQLTDVGISNHFMYKLTDVLALGDALERLDSGMDLTKLSRLVRAGSSQMAASYESVLDALRCLLLGSGITPTLIGDAGGNNAAQAAERLDYHTKLQGLLDSAAFKAAASSHALTISDLTAMAASELVTRAELPSGLAYRYALKALNPFAVLGPDLLYDGSGPIPSHNTNGELDLYDYSARSGTLTTEFIADRAAFLSWKVLRNTTDNTGVVVSPAITGALIFADKPGDAVNGDTINVVNVTQARAGASTLALSKAPKYVFGSDNDDPNLEGGTQADHLYGGGGNDTLTGKAGNDYLEGGAGSDTYVYSSGDGFDTILDIGGEGAIQYDGVALTGGRLVDGADGVWQSEDERFVYMLTANAAGGNTLTITGPNEGRIQVLNYHLGELGITLDDAVVTPTPASGGREIRGDWAYKIFSFSAPFDPAVDLPPLPEGYSWFSLGHDGMYLQIDELGNVVRDPDVPSALPPEFLSGSAGADHMVSGVNGDNLVAKGGSDYLEGSAAMDGLGGGEGDDFIEGNGFARPYPVDDVLQFPDGEQVVNGTFGDGIAGGAGDDVMFAERAANLDALLDPNTAATGHKGALMRGDAGDDEIYADAGDNALFGGTGKDVIVGGAGNDFLDGDDAYFPDNPFMAGEHRYKIEQGATPFDVKIYPVAMWLDGEFEYYRNGGGDDILDGGTGDDILLGMAGDDTLIGGDGNDVLAGWEADDVLEGGDGNDLMAGDFGRYEQPSERVTGFNLKVGAGSLPEGESGPIEQRGGDYMDGGDGDDVMYGEGGDDVLLGGSGADEIWGDAPWLPEVLAGDDELRGGEGADTEDGGAGNDRLFGDAGADTLRGGAGDDLLDGGADADVLDGGEGNDALDGGEGADVLSGDFGDDYLDGGAGDDVLVSGAGADTLLGGPGLDVLRGGAGDDTYVFNFGDGRETIEDNEGKNRIVLGAGVSRSDLSASVDGSTLLLSLGTQGDAIATDLNQQTISGYDFADGSTASQASVIAGALGAPLRVRNAQNQAFTYGTNASDVLAAEGPGEEVYGAGGDDMLVAAAGGTFLDGGTGSDTYRFGRGDGSVVVQDDEKLAGDVDRIRLADDVRPADVMLYRVGSDLRLAIESTGDTLTVQRQFDGPAKIGEIVFGDGTAWDGAEIESRSLNPIEGTAGDDNLEGTTGNDAIRGLAGNDRLAGKDGNDVLDGGDGADTFVVDAADPGADLVLDSGGISQDDFASWYYQSAGVANVDESTQFGGDWVVVGDTDTAFALQAALDGGTGNSLGNDPFREGSDSPSFLYASLEALQADLGAFGIPYRAADVSFIEPLPELPQIAANDYAALEPLYAAGVIQKDSIEFAAGITLDDLIVSRGADGTTLDFALADRELVKVRLAQPGDALGTGVESFRFADGATHDLPYMLTLSQVNHAPTLAQPIDDQAALLGSAFDFSVPVDTFSDTDAGDSLSYTATLSDGSPLPAWLSFDPATRTFSGTPQLEDFRTVSITVQVTDAGGLSAQDTFDLSVTGAIVGTQDGDQLYGSESGETLYGLGGSDGIYAGGGDDTLVGGQGEYDYLEGGQGDDVYVYEPGGIDGILDAGGNDALRFAAGIAPGDVLVTRDPYGALYLEVGTADNRVEVYNWFTGENELERVEFADGTVWDAAELASRIAALPATEAFDILNLADADDVLDALGGDDWVFGNGGNDILSGGEGGDSMEGDAGHNLLLGGAGDDFLAGSSLDPAASRNLFVGGAGNDGISTGPAGSVIAFNAAEGEDSVYSVPGDAYVLSMGASAANIVLSAPEEGWVRVGIGTGGVKLYTLYSDPVPSGTLQLMGDDVRTYDLNAVVQAFLDARAQDPTITEWSAAQALQDSLLSVSTTEAIGGALAWEYARNGSLDALSTLERQEILASDGFGVAPQPIAARDPDETLVGGDGKDTLVGHSGNDTLDGGRGVDTLIGGRGDDTYVVDRTADVVIENPGEGNDTVLSAATYTLPANVENLVLTGTRGIRGTGNELANTITGNSAGSVLDGGAGADTLIGGAGNDTYIVDDPGDAVVENAAEGTDTVKTSVSYTLPDNVERLVLTGTASLNGFGNELANVIAGNGGANLLEGYGGNDTLSGNLANDLVQGGAGNDVLRDNGGNNLLDGGSGNDKLTGAGGNELFIGGSGNDTLGTGAGADIIAFNRGDGQDIVAASQGADNTLSLGGGISYQDLVLRKSGSNLILQTGTNPQTGVSERITFSDWYAASADNRSVARMQLIAEAMSGFDPASTDPLFGSKVQTFDFLGLVDAFNAARAANPSLKSWTVVDAIAEHHLGGSDDEAVGGDLAYAYGRNGTLAGMGLDQARAAVDDPAFGTDAQALTPALEGGEGSNRVATGAGWNVISYNAGDGVDTVYSDAGASNTLSLGGGIRYSDLSLSKAGNDLELNAGETGKVVLKDWYAGSKNLLDLQVILDASGDYDAASADPLFSRKVQKFDFLGLANAFDQALAQTPGLTSWALTDALLQYHLSASDDSATGGDLAYGYGRNGTLAGMDIAMAQQVIGAPGFGSDAQALRPFVGLREGLLKLSG